jgi:Co/Zn/Cd efflux system component
MGAELVDSGPATDAPLAPAAADPAGERRTLLWLLAINAVMFVVEALAGWWAESSGLLADGLDMFADAAVYGTALYAVGRGRRPRGGRRGWPGCCRWCWRWGCSGRWRSMRSTARAAGGPMMAVSVLALAANAACLCWWPAIGTAAPT